MTDSATPAIHQWTAKQDRVGTTRSPFWSARRQVSRHQVPQMRLSVIVTLLPAGLGWSSMSATACSACSVPASTVAAPRSTEARHHPGQAMPTAARTACPARIGGLLGLPVARSAPPLPLCPGRDPGHHRRRSARRPGRPSPRRGRSRICASRPGHHRRTPHPKPHWAAFQAWAGNRHPVPADPGGLEHSQHSHITLPQPH